MVRIGIHSSQNFSEEKILSIGFLKSNELANGIPKRNENFNLWAGQFYVFGEKKSCMIYRSVSRLLKTLCLKFA